MLDHQTLKGFLLAGAEVVYTSGIYRGIRHKPVGMCWSNTSYKSPPSLAWLPLYVSQPSHKPTPPLSLWRTVVWHTKCVCGKLYFRLYIHTSTVPFFLIMLFSLRLPEWFHLFVVCPLYLLSAPTTVETKPLRRGVSRGAQSTPYFV